MTKKIQVKHLKYRTKPTQIYMNQIFYIYKTKKKLSLKNIAGRIKQKGKTVIKFMKRHKQKFKYLIIIGFTIYFFLIYIAAYLDYFIRYLPSAEISYLLLIFWEYSGGGYFSRLKIKKKKNNDIFLLFLRVIYNFRNIYQSYSILLKHWKDISKCLDKWLARFCRDENLTFFLRNNRKMFQLIFYGRNVRFFLDHGCHFFIGDMLFLSNCWNNRILIRVGIYKITVMFFNVCQYYVHNPRVFEGN